MTCKEHLWNVAKALGITVVTVWLYYRSLWLTLLLLPLFIWHFRMMEEECVRKKEMEFQVQFKEAIQAVSAALNTGYSVENAFREAQKELKLIYPETARISKELLFIIRQLRIHVPMEQILEELGMRVQIEDVRNFVTVFAAAKKNGGNMIAIIQDTVRQIGDKIDVKREIDTILAAKRYEFRVMSAIPYAIIGYMSFSFPEFMDSLYGNIFGIGVMTVCLGIYMGAYYLGVRMIRIEV
ncbi:type II secretion system protein F [Lachnospiraceae bacterium WCA-9-b2]|uniref:Type II secretion system protein F n=1 Tax=Sporofaciens musculi TaxID=2681861 RepID=A0A7X3MD60_9FIRM|nr:type II secretion system protein F [Dorea sp.]MXP74249.1 type II secretion system protein F [Sporofaciens musculi]